MSYPKKSIRIKPLNLAIGFILLICSIFSQFKVSSYTAFIIFIFYMAVLFWKNTEIYLKYLSSIFSCVAVLISLIVIEFGEYYVSERRLMGQFVGSIPLLLLSYWMFFESLKYFDIKYEKRAFRTDSQNFFIDSFFSKNNRRTQKILRYLTIVTDALLGYMFICVIKNPSFLLGLDRNQYSQLFTYSFLYSKVLSWAKIFLIPCILSCVYGSKGLGLIGIVCFMLHSFWVGEKFGSFMSVLGLFLLIFYPQVRIKKEKIRNTASKGLVIIGLLVLFSAFAFSFTSDIDIGEYFALRIAGQGAMWWGTYSVSNGMPHLGQIINEIEGFLFGSLNTCDNVGAKYGIYNIMYLCCPADKVNYDLQYLNARYTEAGFASAYYIFGVFGPIIFALFCAFLYSKITNYFLYFLNKKKIIEAALSLRIYYLLSGIMCMFTFNQFRSVIVICAVFWIFVMKNKKLKIKN